MVSSKVGVLTLLILMFLSVMGCSKDTTESVSNKDKVSTTEQEEIKDNAGVKEDYDNVYLSPSTDLVRGNPNLDTLLSDNELEVTIVDEYNNHIESMVAYSSTSNIITESDAIKFIWLYVEYARHINNLESDEEVDNVTAVTKNSELTTLLFKGKYTGNSDNDSLEPGLLVDALETVATNSHKANNELLGGSTHTSYEELTKAYSNLEVGYQNRYIMNSALLSSTAKYLSAIYQYLTPSDDNVVAENSGRGFYSEESDTLRGYHETVTSTIAVLKSEGLLDNLSESFNEALSM